MYTDHIHKTERLVFEAIDPEQDVEWYHTLRSDPSVAQWNMPYVIAPWTKTKAAQYLENDAAIVEVVIKLPSETEAALPNTPIGFMRLVNAGHGMDHHRRAEFIISLLPAYHGKGYGSESLCWLFEVGFQRANLNRISGWYNAENHPAAKCYAALGMRIEGVSKQITWMDGKYHDRVYIAQLRSEWEEIQKKGEMIVNGLNGEKKGEAIANETNGGMMPN